jgi:hypothetical protein
MLTLEQFAQQIPDISPTNALQEEIDRLEAHRSIGLTPNETVGLVHNLLLLLGQLEHERCDWEDDASPIDTLRAH